MSGSRPGFVCARHAANWPERVLIRRSRLYQIERLAPKAQKQIRADVLRTHEGIARAIEEGEHANALEDQG